MSAAIDLMKGYTRVLHLVLFIILGAIFSLSGAPYNAALAQDVSIRSGLHEDYTRVVFDWAQNAIDYSVNEPSATVTEITFTRNAAQLEQNGLDIADSQQVQDVSILQTAPLKVKITHANNADTRVFKILNRVVVDVKVVGSKNNLSASSTPTVAPKEAPKVSSAPPKDASKVEQLLHAKNVANESKIDIQVNGVIPEVKKVDEVPPAMDGMKEPEAEKAAAADGAEAKDEKSYFERLAEQNAETAPHKVIVSATKAFNMAAFIRAGRLWVVMDMPDYYVMPQIRGPHIETFGDFNRMNGPESSIFYVDLPKDKTLYATAQGGGLNWSIILTERPPTIERKWPQRDVDPNLLRGGKSLTWPIVGIRRIVELDDPFLEDKIYVGLAEQADINGGEYKSYVDFTVLDSIVGIAIVPKVDDLTIRNTPSLITINKGDGLALIEPSDIRVYELGLTDKVTGIDPNAEGDAHNARITGRIFKFDQWLLGGKAALRTNQEVMMQGLNDRDQQGRAEDLVSLAKLELANARGAEAVGYLKLAGEEYKPFRQGDEYLALLGAAYAMNNQFDVAFRVLMVPSLNKYQELEYWRAYALAELDDWSQAGERAPDNTRFLRSYPKDLRLALANVLAEVYLRRGDIERADEVLRIIEAEKDNMRPQYQAGLIYLKGELKRQKGDNQGALAEWYKLRKHSDDFYRVRARLAIANLRHKMKEITIDKAIDDLEQMRFAWRGDDLETTINFRLGQLYIEKGSFIKGLSVLREAASMSAGTIMGKQIADYMRSEYKDLFIGEKASKLTPLQLAMIYEEFSELTPAGKEADKLMQSLAERLVDVDLLDRAIDILKNQVENRTTGTEQVKLALRLAGIQLINNDNREALKTLSLAEKAINQIPILESVPYRREMNLLRARGLSRDGQARDALVLLNNMKQDDDVVRLKADIAWTSGRWNDAAEALEDLVTRYDLKPNDTISSQQANTILNWMVALSLSGNRHVIANVREQYGKQMEQTDKGRLFEVVSRPRQNAILADRQTIDSIVGEVDIFSDFLESYRGKNKPEN